VPGSRRSPLCEKDPISSDIDDSIFTFADAAALIFPRVQNAEKRKRVFARIDRINLQEKESIVAN
jgi:hypothetical protein